MKKNAFTLVEIMVSLLIVAFGITCLLGVMGKALTMSAEIKENAVLPSSFRSIHNMIIGKMIAYPTTTATVFPDPSNPDHVAWYPEGSFNGYVFQYYIPNGDGTPSADTLAPVESRKNGGALDSDQNVWVRIDAYPVGTPTEIAGSNWYLLLQETRRWN